MIDFTTDWEKMRDYFQISKEEFLASYSYVTEAEYDATKKVVEKKDALDKDSYKDLSDGEILDIIFSKFKFVDDKVNDTTEQLMILIDKALAYKKYLADILYQDALRTSRAELQDVSFFQEDTTNSWTLEQLQIQYVKDQISFFEAGNLDDQVNETWEKIND
tara:strand:+ start:229 stop:714 length:486 start_codon:yes stop_codon:yes gene_type:complete